MLDPDAILDRPRSPPQLRAPGAADAAFEAVLDVAELPRGCDAPGHRAAISTSCSPTRPSGIVAIDDRCPHMCAPLSIGELDGCVVACPLHEGRFDLCSGDTVQMPTTGGLDADGAYHPTWSPAGREPRSIRPARRPRRAG